MTEPATSAAGGIAAWKLAGGAAGIAAGGTVLGTVMVMLMTRPRTDREWTAAILSTVVSSLGGGSALVMRWGLQSWLESFVGAVAIGGLYFTCALPGWLLVRIVFNTFARWGDKSAVEVAAEVKQVLP